MEDEKSKAVAVVGEAIKEENQMVASPSTPSHALEVVVETDEVLDALCGAVPNPKARAFLRAYRIRKLLIKAAAAAGVTPQAHYYWLGRRRAPALDGYVEAFLAVNEEIDRYWEELAERRALEGWYEEVFNGKGELIRRRTRHDSGYLKMVLAGRMPEKYGSAKATENHVVNIIIERPDETAGGGH